MQGFFSVVNWGLEAVIFTDDLQRVFLYTKMLVSSIFDFLLYDITQGDKNNGRLSN